MRRVVLRVGRLAFWLAWPVWLVYFRLNSHRSRILVVHDGKLLLLHDYLGGKHWGLPGGGAKRGETNQDAAVRELKEEIGIEISPDDLRALGDYLHSEAGLKYRAHFFLLTLSESPAIERRRHEIAEVAWFTKDELQDLAYNNDTAYALRAYESDLKL